MVTPLLQASAGVVVWVDVDVATEGQGYGSDAVISTQVGCHFGLLVQAVVGPRHIQYFRIEEADIAAHIHGQRFRPRLIQSKLGFQLQALGDGVTHVGRA